MTPSRLSSRERMLAAIKRQGADHVPFSPILAQGPQWPAPLFWRDQIERAERMLELGLDPCIDIWLPDPQPHPDVVIKSWRERKGSEVLLTKEYHTPAGILRQVVRETEDWCSASHGPWVPTTFGTEKRVQFGIDLFDDHNVSRRVEPWVKGPEDLAKLQAIIRPPDGYLLDEWRMDAERAMEFARKYGLLTVARRTIVGDAFQWFCDIPQFLLWMSDLPEWVAAFLGVFQDWSLKLVQLALEVGVDVVQYRGWYEIPTYWGLKYWKQYLVPGIEAQTRMVHDAGKLHAYLLPGGHGVYARALKEMGLDVLVGIDPRVLHGGDLFGLFDTLGSSKAFWGGINAEVTLESGDPARIDEAVGLAVESLGRAGGLILSAILFGNLSAQKIMLFVEAWRKYCLNR